MAPPQVWAGFGSASYSGGEDPDPQSRLAAGKLLLAGDNITTEPFAQSVILLTSYGRDGAIGVIINKPTKMLLSMALPTASKLKGSKEVLFYGGPVSRNIFTILMESEDDLAKTEGVIPVFGKVYFVTNREIIAGSVGNKEKLYRGFAGYAGWAPGQLEGEMARGDWSVASADSKTVFSGAPQALWGKFRHQRKGGRWATIPLFW